MTEVISVKFKDGGKAYYFDPAGHKVSEGDRVIVEMQSGKEIGNVSAVNHLVEDGDIVQPLRKMLRIATEKDLKKVEENKQKEADAVLSKMRIIAKSDGGGIGAVTVIEIVLILALIVAALVVMFLIIRSFIMDILGKRVEPEVIPDRIKIKRK